MGTVHEIRANDAGGANVLDLDVLHVGETYQQPLILTPEYVEQLARMNAVSRRLRELGYRVQFEDAMPTDSKLPLIHIDLGTAAVRSIMLLSGGCTEYPERSLAQSVVDGVRVRWSIERPAAH